METMILLPLRRLQNKKSTILSFQRCYNALLNGFKSPRMTRKTSRNNLVPMIGHDILDVPVEIAVVPFDCYSSCIHCVNNIGIKQKLFENICCSSTFETSKPANVIVCRGYKDDAYKKTVLINKINKGLGHSTSSLDSTESSVEQMLSAEEYKYATLEKKIIHLMGIWEIDEAINLLKDSVANGADPDRTVILRMLWQIADLGKVECLLDLYDTLLKENMLVSSERFYICLCSAVFSSGDVTKGMDILTRSYEAGMDSGDIDVFFTVLATKIIKEYEDHWHLVEEFVDTVLSRDPPAVPARAILWRCFVLSGRFDKADELMLEHVELKKLIPAQVTLIVQLTTSLEFDKEAVLLWLIQQSYLKEGLRASALHLLVQLKCEENDWSHVIKYIIVAMEHDVKPGRETMINFLSKFFDECSEEDELTFWKTIGDQLQTKEINLELDEDGENKTEK